MIKVPHNSGAIQYNYPELRKSFFISVHTQNPDCVDLVKETAEYFTEIEGFATDQGVGNNESDTYIIFFSPSEAKVICGTPTYNQIPVLCGTWDEIEEGVMSLFHLYSECLANAFVKNRDKNI